MMVCKTETKKRETSYKVLEKGHRINGTIIAKLQATSGDDSSLRCVVMGEQNKQFMVVSWTALLHDLSLLSSFMAAIV